MYWNAVGNLLRVQTKKGRWIMPHIG